MVPWPASILGVAMRDEADERNMSQHRLTHAVRSAQVAAPCSDLAAAMDFFINRLGFRLDAIFPADAPSTAVISGHGVTLRLEQTSGQIVAPTLRLLVDRSALPAVRELEAPGGIKIEFVGASPPIEVPEGKQEFVVTKPGGAGAWATGRADMQYRDLIPSRLGGRYIASHIRIPDGGPVPDYVHYHRVRFQMIFCKAGWVKVVYEDHGPPFVMRAGDCVLQPPEIRHKVLEASPGLEVIEIACPAVHETFADHDLPLPNDRFDPDRLFTGQRFVRHAAKDAKWSPWRIAGIEERDTGIAAATNGLAGVSVIRSSGEHSGSITHGGEFLFFFVLSGEFGLRSNEFGSHQLQQVESCVIPAGVKFELTAKPGLEMLAVALPPASIRRSMQ
jgi:quercetin dioxygenase-like cupin family protein